jgi:MFS family permease
MTDAKLPAPPPPSAPWYAGVTRYQWLVLVVASLGWVFDVFEGQIFVASMNEAMPALLPADVPPDQRQRAEAYYKDVTLATFLLGGALGGVLFGALADRIGRKRTMAYTIGLYSAFTCLSAFAQTWWQLAGFRFLVALGVGGEWAVASALVAEVFSTRARAWSQSIFHASSVLGTYLAIAAGAWIVANPNLGFTLSLGEHHWELNSWRLGFLLGALPALLIIWVRISLREPERWLRARAVEPDAQTGRVAALFTGEVRRRTLVGVGLAAVGLATFWGAHVYGKDKLKKAYVDRLLERLPPEVREARRPAVEQANAGPIKRWEMLGMFLVTTGGGVGLVLFGPLSERLGRRGAFLLFCLGGLGSSLVLYQLLHGIAVLCLFLPVFGFLTLGMHAGYAVYFPELFPTRLRGTGGGFCFNVGRVLAAPVLFVGGWMKSLGFTLEQTASLVSLLFLVGALLLVLAPETRGQDLQE